jgi:hypothetical protein
MDIKELVKGIRDYTGKYDMPFERYLMLNNAADKLEQLSAENQQLRNDLIMQTALAQNGQSAIETHKQLTKRLNAAIEDLKKAIDGDDLCSFCKHNAPCQSEKCDKYVEGRGMTFEKTGQYIDEKWTCIDFTYGTCPKLEDTPCNGCFENNMKGFEWRGVKCE